MTNGSSQGIFVIVALVIFGIFVLISYLLFRDTMKPSLAKIYCDAFTITSKNTGFGKLGNCGVDSENGESDKIQRTYYKIREATPEKGWSEVWVLVKELDNGHVEIIDSGNKDKFAEGDLGKTLIGDISFPDTVGNGLVIENIGVGSFRNAKFSNVMKLPSELIILDDYSLQQSNFGGEAKFPEKLEIIGIEALRDSRFTGNFPNNQSIKEIRDNAFKESIFEGLLPNLPNVELVGKGAFENSEFTGNFNGIGNNVSIDTSDDTDLGNSNNEDKPSDNSHGYSSNGGVVIADGAFAKSKFTGKTVIPSNVSVIGDNAFRNSNFTVVDFSKNENIVVIGDNAFENSKITGALYLPDSVKYIGNRAFYSSNFINKDWILPEKLEYIGDFAFSNSSMTGNLVMKNNLKYIGDSAFLNSYKVSSANVVRHDTYDTNIAKLETTTRFYLTLSKSLEHIGANAFRTAEFYGDFIMPENLEYIGDYAFLNSFKYFTQNVAHKTTYVRDTALSKTYYLTTATITYKQRSNFKFNKNIKYIGLSAFRSALFKDISTEIPNKLEYIGVDAFAFSFIDDTSGKYFVTGTSAYERGLNLINDTIIRNTEKMSQTIKLGNYPETNSLVKWELIAN